VARSGTSSTKIRLTFCPSGASKGIGCFILTTAPSASLMFLMRPWGMAIPCPNPVDPSFSARTGCQRPGLRAMLWLFSKQQSDLLEKPVFAETSRSSRTFDTGRSLAIRFMMSV